MASPAVKPQSDSVPAEQDDLFVSPEEGRRMFDEATRARLGISGQEFIRRWEAGAYDAMADQPGSWHIDHLIALIPFARQES